MDLKEIQNFIRFVSRSGVSEVKLEIKDIKLTIRSGSHYGNATPQTPVFPVPQQVIMSSPSAADSKPNTTDESTHKKTEEENDKYTVIKSPIIGTFYRKPSPDKIPFVEVGDTISPGDTLCVIEAMKLFNEIESEISGKIVKVLAEDMAPVEFDQPLFLVDPS